MEAIFQKLAKLAVDKNRIQKEDYEKYDVKHGLRNQDGSGVTVGLTDISSVVGYRKTEEGVLPVEGDLIYRGISINDIINGIVQDENRNAFTETTYLLLFGVLPTREELEEFSNTLLEFSDLPRDFARNILSTYHTPNIMNLIARSILTLYSKDENPDDTAPENLVRQGVELIAKLPTIIAYSHRVIKNWYYDSHLILRKTQRDYNLAENFLYKLRENGEFTDLEARVLNISLILHAEHGGGNNSTFSTRVVSSTGTDTYSAISAAIGSLKGPLHGGANLRVIEMMNQMKQEIGDVSNEKKVEAYVVDMLRRKKGDQSGKVYGFGHAVYTVNDPRTTILKRYAREMARQHDVMDDFELYSMMEDLVPRVFAEIKETPKGICANVDFYSGFIYECMGIPRQVYTPLFAMARISGWIAHRIEEVLVSKRIIRPAYKNITELRKYELLDDR